MRTARKSTTWWRRMRSYRLPSAPPRISASATEVHVSVRPVCQSRKKTMTAAKAEKLMRPMRTALGGKFSSSEKAAPVLMTCERRKTPGMIGMS